MFTSLKRLLKTTASTKPKKRTAFRPVLEGLEGRTLMAGNIAATFDSAKVLTLHEVKGQAGQHHAVDINQLADGTIRVEGATAADGTKSLINGAPFVDIHGVQFLNVFFGAGADFVSVGEKGPISLKNVSIGVGNTIVKSPGAPHDAVIVENFTGNVLRVATGAGDDSVFLRNLNLNGNVDIFTGHGSNFLSVLNSSVRNFSAFMGDGPDSVFMENLSARFNIGVDTDVPGVSGNTDSIFMGHVRAGDSLFINTNGGSDVVKLYDVQAARNLGVNLGAGDDSLNLLHVRANDIRVNGGTGFDRLTKIDVIFGKHMRMAGFEEITNFQVAPGVGDSLPVLTL